MNASGMTMLKRLTVIVATVLALVTQAGPLSAQPLPPNGKPDFSANLIVGGTDPSNPKEAWIGIHVRLGPGWHTYWRSPGDAGAAPEFDWRGSQNVTTVEVEWPAPTRITSAGIDTFGYDKEVVFPVHVRLRDPHTPTHLSLKLALFVCSSICTRSDLNFDATIAPSARCDGPLALINQWRTKVPHANAPDLALSAITLEGKPSSHLRVTVTSATPLNTPDLFVDGDDSVIAGRPQRRAHDGQSTIFMLPLSGTNAAHPVKPLHVTLVDGNRAVEATLNPTPPVALATRKAATPVTPAAHAPLTLWSMLAVALLGGLILNFMPCVFPVLSLKMLSLVGQAARDTRTVRTHFLASAAGVVASFVLLAAALAALKALGAQIGWGIQFQQPIFLVVMAAILVALSANLLDLYDIHLPSNIGGIVGQSAGHNSMAAHFFNGLVMTLLATPCSAPFVGTAIGFALSQGPWQIFEIFAALGLGMASPYLVLAALPQVARLLPRPGRWMLTVRRIAAIAMAGTALWLLTILADIAGLRAALIAGASFGLLLWLLALRRQQFAHTIAGALIAGLAGIAIFMADERSPPAAAHAVDGIAWQALAPQKIQAMVKNGHTVFVDIGAAWCVTCKVNEAKIDSSAAIHRRLAEEVVPMRADWTRPDEQVGAYLRSFHRYGLPFNAVFGPGAPNGIVLPELLTPTAVLDAFDRAAAKTASH